MLQINRGQTCNDAMMNDEWMAKMNEPNNKEKMKTTRTEMTLK